MRSIVCLAIVAGMFCATSAARVEAADGGARARALRDWSHGFLDCVPDAGRRDGGFCPRFCGAGHTRLPECEAGEVCVADGDPMQLGIAWGCYRPCDAGCSKIDRCLMIKYSPFSSEAPDAGFALCVSPGAALPR